ncbi:MAG: hypothetical protein J7545_23345 [Roseofilum sp. SBFL]|uniref:hypothetical protein n=1 Tax=unclassified Roseofilum TaxID=2620099 RepID=UPI001B26E825|nr:MULTISPECIES: hypothetical protein [unclassified Roseofilum]MBP0014099.1 hypothetical protein [Roseofilum sp. SID3]MBP0026724.1 hypothetical protein [Roseofilum sp. SID2]MBP0036291.1 hypothetical protein [Roseofilum sp. SID1]MBP0044872.1 hypothetical protein [Roseofilum sp. SBFL]
MRDELTYLNSLRIVAQGAIAALTDNGKKVTLLLQVQRERERSQQTRLELQQLQ